MGLVEIEIYRFEFFMRPNEEIIFKILHFFFYQGFLSWTLTTHRTAGEGRGPFFATLHAR